MQDGGPRTTVIVCAVLHNFFAASHFLPAFNVTPLLVPLRQYSCWCTLVCVRHSRTVLVMRLHQSLIIHCVYVYYIPLQFTYFCYYLPNPARVSQSQLPKSKPSCLVSTVDAQRMHTLLDCPFQGMCDAARTTPSHIRHSGHLSEPLQRQQHFKQCQCFHG